MQNRELPWDSLVLGKFRLLQKLPGGQRTDCHQVELNDWDMPLRLKKFPAGYADAQASKRLYSVWRRWIALTGHVHIANAYHVIEEGSDRWLLSEYIPGLSLRQYAEQQPRLEEAIELARQLASGIEYAHANRLYHGALKPENVLIDHNKQVAITDFYGAPEYAGDPQQHDIRCYGLLLRYLFFVTGIDEPSDKPLGDGRWPLPTCLRQLVEKLLASTPVTAGSTSLWQEIAETMSGAYEEITHSSLRHTGILPMRWYKENLHKHAFSYMQKQEKIQAERVWALASNSQPSSVSALWNWHLFYLREGIVSLNDFLRNINNFEDCAPAEVACAKGRLAIELGTNMLEVLVRTRELRQQPPVSLPLLRVAGELAWALHNLPEALECWRELIRQPGCNAGDWYRLAIAAWETGDWQTCTDACRAGLAKDPTHPLLPIVELSCQAGQGNWQEAQRQLAALLANGTPSFWVFLYAVEFYVGRGIYARQVDNDSREQARRLCNATADHPVTLRLAANCIACGGDVDKFKSSPRVLDRWSQQRSFQHNNLVTAVALSQDGEQAVSGDCEGNLYCWSGKEPERSKCLTAHSKHISDLAISDDGRLLVCGSWDHSATVWNLADATCRWCISGHADKVSSVAISGDGQRVITGSWDGTARVWDIATQQQIALFATADKSWVTDVAFTPDGKQALICDGGECMYLWDIERQTAIAQMGGSSVALTADGTMAVSSRYNYIECWQLPSGDSLGSHNVGHKEVCLAVGGSLPLLLSRSEDDVLSVWHVADGSKVLTLPCEDAICAYLTRDGKYLISGNGETAYVWENTLARPFPLPCSAGYWAADLRGRPQVPKIVHEKLRKAENACYRRDFSAAYQLYQELQKIPGYEQNPLLRSGMQNCGIAAGAKRDGLRLLHLQNETTLKHWATSAAISLGGEITLIASDDEPVACWNLPSGYRVHTAPSGKRCIGALSLAQDGSLAAIGSWDGSLRLRRLDSDADDEIVASHSGFVTAVDMDSAGRIVLCGTRAGEISLYDVNRHQFTMLAAAGAERVQLSPESIAHTVVAAQGDYALSAAVDGTMCVWDVANKQCLGRHQPHRRFATAVSLSADGRRVASATRDGVILCWHASSGEVFARLPAGEVIRGLFWAGDDWLLSLAGESSLRLWRVSSAQCIYQYALHKNFLTSWDITADAQFLVSTSEDRDVKLWQLEWSWTF